MVASAPARGQRQPMGFPHEHERGAHSPGVTTMPVEFASEGFGGHAWITTPSLAATGDRVPPPVATCDAWSACGSASPGVIAHSLRIGPLGTATQRGTWTPAQVLPLRWGQGGALPLAAAIPHSEVAQGHGGV